MTEFGQADTGRESHIAGADHDDGTDHGAVIPTRIDIPMLIAHVYP